MRNKVNIPLIEFESKVPVIKLNLGDRDVFALVDTGSESTLIDNSLQEYKAIKKKKLGMDMSFVGLNGKTEDKKIELLSGKFSIDDAIVKISGISANLSTISEHLKKNYNTDIHVSILLGCDFLDCYNAVIDFEEHILFLKDNC